MSSSIWKSSLLVIILISTGCATRINEVKQSDPHRIAVIIGSKLTGRESIHPAARSILSLAAQVAFFAVPVGPLATSIGGLATGAATNLSTQFIGEENTITVNEAINSLVYKRVECVLSEKGYTPKLIMATPVDFEFWSGTVPENYDDHVTEFYSIDEQYLSDIEADAILYVEYEITIYKEDIDEEQLLLIDDLLIDLGHSHIYAVSKPPENKVIFTNHVFYRHDYSRADLHETIDGIVWLDAWPYSFEVTESEEDRCNSVPHE